MVGTKTSVRMLNRAKGLVYSSAATVKNYNLPLEKGTRACLGFRVWCPNPNPNPSPNPNPNPNQVLVQEAIQVLQNKAATISEVLKDAVMGQASTATAEQ